MVIERLCLCVLLLGTIAKGDGDADYTPHRPVNAFFFESFTDGWENRWVHGAESENREQFVVGSGSKPSLDGDVGLLVPEESRFYAISAPFETPFDLDTDLAISYEVRYHKNLECGGAYIKLLSKIEDEEFDAEDFDNGDRYTIMFGPDKCGTNNKVHFIFQHKNPVSGEFVEHHLKVPPSIKNDRYTHVYTLIVKKDNTYELLIDQESLKSGSLLEDFDPPIVPPKEIDDPDDEKPDDWVDEEMIPDPESKKPEDWDEDAPYFIPDPEAVMPEGWLENEPLEISDPDAEKPEDWDDEFDGEFEAPLVDNPKCKEIGCGPWEAPEIENPDYVGPWEPDYIENPDYIGEWEPKQIPNPDFFETKNPYDDLLPIAALGIEIWTIQDDVEFDNFYLGHDIDDMNQFIEKTYGQKSAAEEELMKDDEDESEDGGESLMNKAGSYVSEFVSEEVMEMVSDNPVYIVLATVILGLIPVLMIVCRSGGDGEKEEEEEDEEPENEKEDSKTTKTSDENEANDDSADEDEEEDDGES